MQLAVIQGGAYDVETAAAVTARDGMAVWAEAFATTGRKPTKDQRGKASKDIKQLLDAGNAPDVVMALARAAGAKCRATVANEQGDTVPPSRRPSATTRATTEAQDLKAQFPIRVPQGEIA